MDIIKELLGNMDDESKNNIYLREIALLMEEIDLLNDELREKEKLLKNYEKQIKDKKQ
tara:strand:- start:113 stop:286 length:174 start_codon:yes stop_codon:yes gene_type:complete